MIFELYCVRDSVTGQFSKPELYYNKAHAVRHMNDTYSKTPIANDVSLYYLGQFDASRGVVILPSDKVQSSSDLECAYCPTFICDCEVIVDGK